MNHYSSSFNPFGSNKAILVDKMIGSAYDVVKLVAMNLAEILYVAQNLDTIQETLQNIRKERVINMSLVPSSGVMIVPLPADIQVEDISYFTVQIKTTTGDLYTPDSGYFKIRIVNDALEITVDPAASAAFVGATFLWSIVFREGL